MVPGVFPYPARNHDPSGRCDAFETNCDVDPISKNVVSFNDHVAQIDTNPKADRLIHFNATVSFG